MGKFVVKPTLKGLKFDLKATNGQVIASSQVYKSLKSCLSGISSVVKNAGLAEVEDQTTEGFEVKKNPKFEVYTDKAGEFRFRLKAKNGQIVATSEGYKSIQACMNGIESIRKNAPEAPVDLPDPAGPQAESPYGTLE